MTTQEIYTLANETTGNQFNNLFNLFSKEEENSFNQLVKLGDKKNIALWTIISERYENKVDANFYRKSYEN